MQQVFEPLLTPIFCPLSDLESALGRDCYKSLKEKILTTDKAQAVGYVIGSFSRILEGGIFIQEFTNSTKNFSVHSHSDWFTRTSKWMKLWRKFTDCLENYPTIIASETVTSVETFS